MPEAKKGKTGKKGGGRIGYWLFAFTFITLGVCFILFTSQSIDVMCYLLGGITVFAAVLNAVITLADKAERGVKFFVKLIVCVLALICGVITIVAKATALEYIVGTVAILLIIDGSFKLHTAVESRAVKIPLWWVLVVLAILGFAGNAYLLKFYNVDQSKWLVAVLGVMLILDGVLNLLTPIYLSVISRRQKEEIKQPSEAEQAPMSENNEE